MNVRYKRPDKKNAFSIAEASQREIEFTLTLKPTEKSGTTIVRNIYECFRMLGDALLVARGIDSQDHLLPIKELLKLNVKTARPIGLIGNLRTLRHNINYYGYSPKIEEVKEVVSIAETCFKPLLEETLRIIKKQP
ncbi:MAG TPA: hypothetical protein VJB90_04255 [Candidatus Nanoarchaeia archaeon]|nr:hypothetical protein [Candidatus Nanoarchaeia archaeon]